MEDKGVTAKQVSVDKSHTVERDSRELQDADLEKVSGGTIVLED